MMKRFRTCLLLTLLCLAVGGISGLFQTSALHDWYPGLVKSPVTPPAAVFPIAWGLLYLGMGLSGGLVMTSGHPSRHRIMALWGIQLALNFGWSVLFFSLRNPLLGMFDIVLLDLFVALYLYSSMRVNRVSGWLFVPYLCWLLFATYLNGYILAANGTGF